MFAQAALQRRVNQEKKRGFSPVISCTKNETNPLYLCRPEPLRGLSLPELSFDELSLELEELSFEDPSFDDESFDPESGFALSSFFDPESPDDPDAPGEEDFFA
jgi:hypothetical protein